MYGLLESHTPSSRRDNRPKGPTQPYCSGYAYEITLMQILRLLRTLNRCSMETLDTEHSNYSLDYRSHVVIYAATKADISNLNFLAVQLILKFNPKRSHELALIQIGRYGLLPTESESPSSHRHLDSPFGRLC
jgi:hypothetical protein